MPLSLPFLQNPIQDSTCHPITNSYSAPLAETVSQTCFILFWWPQWFEECWLGFRCHCWDFEERVSRKPRRVSNVLSLKYWSSGPSFQVLGLLVCTSPWFWIGCFTEHRMWLPLWLYLGCGFCGGRPQFQSCHAKGTCWHKTCHCRQCWLPRCGYEG